jgi:hypothetical protein
MSDFTNITLNEMPLAEVMRWQRIWRFRTF